LVDCLQIADRPKKSDGNDFKILVVMEHPQLPSQKKKLEWVTPKISLMEAGDTAGKNTPDCGEGFFNNSGTCFVSIGAGPS
jgi:hypothetical protein